MFPPHLTQGTLIFGRKMNASPLPTRKPKKKPITSKRPKRSLSKYVKAANQMMAPTTPPAQENRRPHFLCTSGSMQNRLPCLHTGWPFGPARTAHAIIAWALSLSFHGFPFFLTRSYASSCPRGIRNAYNAHRCFRVYCSTQFHRLRGRLLFAPQQLSRRRQRLFPVRLGVVAFPLASGRL